MRILTDDEKKKLKYVKILSLLLLVVAPAVYLIIGNLLTVEPRSGGEMDIMFYVFIILAVTVPLVLPLIKRIQISRFRQMYQGKTDPASYLTAISLTKMSFIDAVYIWGLVVYLLSGDMFRLLLFYPIGIIWSIIYWPREEKLLKILERLEAS